MQNSINPDLLGSSSASLEEIAARVGRLLALSPFTLIPEGTQHGAAVPPGCRVFAFIPRQYHLLTDANASFSKLALARDLLKDYVDLCHSNTRLRQDNTLLRQQVQLVTEINKDLTDDLTGIEYAFASIAPHLKYAVMHDQTVLLNAGLSRQTVEIGQRRLLRQREFSVEVGEGELFGVRSEGLGGVFESPCRLSDVTRDLLRLKIHWLGMQSRQRRLVDGLLELRHVYEANAGEISLLPSEQMLDDPELNKDYRLLQKRFHAVLQQAITDSLTTAFNRNKVNETLEALTADTRNVFSIILFDLDHFKKINDMHGHQEGDRVLVECVQITRRALRKSDILARWGGEEFLVVLRDASLDQALARARHLRELVELHPFFPAHPVTCSYGVVQWVPGEDAAALVAKADVALYEAKRDGRNRVVAHTAAA